MRQYHENNKDLSVFELAKMLEISESDVTKALKMSWNDIAVIDQAKPYKARPWKKERIGDAFINIIFKMLRDGYASKTILNYIRYLGFTTPEWAIRNYIRSIRISNFTNDCEKAHVISTENYPKDVITLSRNKILRHILTIDPKIKEKHLEKEEYQNCEKYLPLLREKYPIIKWIEEVWHEFHSIIMGDVPEKIDEFILKYEESQLSSFCNGLDRDIKAVKNAISYSDSAGSTEGNNNKFKVMKRIAYGRTSLESLAIKCYLASAITKLSDFCLRDLVFKNESDSFVMQYKEFPLVGV